MTARLARWLRLASLGAAVAGAAACRTPPPPPVAPSVVAAGLRLPSVWVFPGSEVPPFCLVLLPDGNARFEGGFLHLNPMRWTYAADHRFTLAVPALRDRDTPALQQHVSEGQLLTYDAATRTMAWALHPDAAAIPLLGYMLVRPQRLTATQRRDLRRACPALGS